MQIKHGGFKTAGSGNRRSDLGGIPTDVQPLGFTGTVVDRFD